MKINILDVIPPSEKQLKAGMLGTVNLAIAADSGELLARLNGFTVRANKSDGSKFLSEPSFKVGEGDTAKYLKHFSLFPLSGDAAIDRVQKEKMSALTQEVLRILDTGGTRRERKDSSAPTQARSEPVVNTKSPWD